VILDLTRPEHRDCLGYACLSRLSPDYDHDGTKREAYLARFRSRPDDAEARFALVLEAGRVFSSPSDSAAIVRALLEGCGVVVLNVHGEGPLARGEKGGIGWAVQPKPALESIEIGAHLMPRIPALILALLACTDAEGAIAALREAGR